MLETLDLSFSRNTLKIDCDHNFTSCKRLRFPTNYKERKKWIEAIRRADKDPVESSRICSCHFVDGKRENGPTKFAWNKGGVLSSLPAKKKPKKLKSEKDQKKGRKRNENEITVVSESDEEENFALQTENDNLRKEIDKLKKQPFGIHCIENDGRLFSYYTGLTRKAFDGLLNSCSKSPLKYFFGWKVDTIELQDQLLITLMKLRLNLDYLDLSVRFGTNEDTISNIVLTFIHTLHEILSARILDETLSEENDRTCKMIAGCAQFDTVTSLRTIEDEKPTLKHKNSLKGLIVIDPNGIIKRCSQLYPMTTSDKEITRRSGVVSKFENIQLITVEEGPESDEVFVDDDSEAYARSVRRLRYFGVLNFIPKPLFMHSSKIFQLCGALINLVICEMKKPEELNGPVGSNIGQDGSNDCGNFIDCSNIDIKEEFDLDVESYAQRDNFEEINCKSEQNPEDDIIMEYDLQLELDV